MTGEKLKACILTTTAIDAEPDMITTKQQPVTVGEMIVIQFLEPWWSCKKSKNLSFRATARNLSS